MSVAAGITAFNHKLLISKEEGYPLSLCHLIIAARYAYSMIVEIVKANIHVALIVLNPKLPISPGIVRYKTPLKNTMSMVLLGNSITLTPGTLTLDIEHDNVMVVHALTKDAAFALNDWHIERLIKQLEETED
jgi:multicomponent Na+:H+ antiporter subunit E